MGTDALDRWLQMRDVTEAEVLGRYTPPPAAITPNVSYFGLSPVTRVQTPDGDFHFQADRLVLLFLDDYVLQKGGKFTRDALLETLGTPAAVLQSRAGRPNKQYVFPEQGVTFSASSEGVDFVEIFPPTDLDTYRQTFYREPPAFRR